MSSWRRSRRRPRRRIARTPSAWPCSTARSRPRASASRPAPTSRPGCRSTSTRQAQQRRRRGRPGDGEVPGLRGARSDVLDTLAQHCWPGAAQRLRPDPRLSGVAGSRLNRRRIAADARRTWPVPPPSHPGWGDASRARFPPTAPSRTAARGRADGAMSWLDRSRLYGRRR